MTQNHTSNVKKGKVLATSRKRKLKKCNKIDLYVVRVNRNGELLDSRPCAECLNAMKSAEIHKVFYSTSNGTVISEKVKYMTSEHLSHNQIRCIDVGHKIWRF